MKISIVILLTSALVLGVPLRKSKSSASEKGIELFVNYRPQSAEDIYQSAKSLANEADGLHDNVTVPAYNGKLLGEYYISASVGTPPQTVNLMLDGQSIASWMGTSKCANCGYRIFNSSRSKTYKETNNCTTYDFRSLGANTGSYSGCMASDKFAVNANSFKATIVGVNSRAGTMFDKFDLHGGLGLGCKAFTYPEGIIHQLLKSHKISQTVAGLYLNGNKSSLTLGYVDTSKFGSLATFRTSCYSTWSIYCSFILAEDTEYEWGYHGFHILFHTPMIVISYVGFKPVLDDINRRLPSTKRCDLDMGTYMIYCQGPKDSLAYSDFLPLGFRFQNDNGVKYSYKISPEDYITIVSDDTRDYALFKLFCPVTNTYTGVGTVFLKKQFMKLEVDSAGQGTFSFGLDAKEHKAHATWANTLIIVWVAIVIVFGGFFLYRKLKDCCKDDSNDHSGPY